MSSGPKAPVVVGVPFPHAVPTPDEGRAQTVALTERQTAEILDGATIEDALNEGTPAADVPSASDSDGTAAAAIASLAAQGVKLPGLTDRRMPKGKR